MSRNLGTTEQGPSARRTQRNLLHQCIDGSSVGTSGVGGNSLDSLTGLGYDQSMLRVKLLVEGARLPVIAHPGEDLGYDLFALESVSLEPRTTVRAGQALPSRRAIRRLERHLGCWSATARRSRRKELQRREA